MSRSNKTRRVRCKGWEFWCRKCEAMTQRRIGRGGVAVCLRCEKRLKRQPKTA